MGEKTIDFYYVFSLNSMTSSFSSFLSIGTAKGEERRKTTNANKKIHDDSSRRKKSRRESKKN